MQGHDTDRIKNDARDYSVVCLQCGSEFEATRSDATFCSAKCRVARSQEPKKLANALAYIELIGRTILSYSVRYRKNERVYQAVKALHVIIGKALANFEQE